MNKILVTGGHGFLGKEVIKQLHEFFDASEVIFPRSSECDFTNKFQTIKLFEDHNPNVVIHLAAQVGGISAIKNNAGQYFYDNMMMGLNLIEASRIFRINKFIFIGSGCAYPKCGKLPFKEEEIWDGYVDENVAPYAIAKKSLITMLQSYHHQYNLNSISLIPTNLYGPHDHFDSENNHVIPSLITKIVNAKNNNVKTINCWGSGDQTRDFLYVVDAARAIVKSVFISVGKPEIINIGSGVETSIKTVANQIINLIDDSIKIKWDTSRPEGQPRRLMDINKAKEILDWAPETNLLDGLKKTITFYINKI